MSGKKGARKRAIKVWQTASKRHAQPACGLVAGLRRCRFGPLPKQIHTAFGEKINTNTNKYKNVSIPKTDSKQKMDTKQKKQWESTNNERPKNTMGASRMWQMHGM